MKRKQNGITLIATIITIIVMLILAGVALKFTVLEDGIIQKAQNAQTVHLEAEVKEQLQISISQVKINYKELNANQKDVTIQRGQDFKVNGIIWLK